MQCTCYNAGVVQCLIFLCHLRQLFQMSTHRVHASKQRSPTKLISLHCSGRNRAEIVTHFPDESAQRSPMSKVFDACANGNRFVIFRSSVVLNLLPRFRKMAQSKLLDVCGYKRVVQCRLPLVVEQPVRVNWCKKVMERTIAVGTPTMIFMMLMIEWVRLFLTLGEWGVAQFLLAGAYF